jgi:hypothetical protein
MLIFFSVEMASNYINKPVTVAVRSEAWVLAGWLLGSNPAQGMDVCPSLSVLCCPV